MTTTVSTASPSAVYSVVAWCRREAVTVVLALVVAGFLVVTPGLTIAMHFERTASILMPPDRDTLAVFTAVAGACVVVGVLLTKRSALLATGLTLLPFLMVPWWQTFVWGWLLGTITVAALAATVSWRRAVAPYAAALSIVAVYCKTETPAVLPIGFVTAGLTPGSRLVVFVLYVAAITAVVAIIASISTLERARRQELSALVKETHALHIELIAGERAQVARDLHDVVAHHVSLVAVRAESAPYQHPDLNAAARAVLADIAEDARQALGELRQVLVVLQRTEVSGNGQPSRAPQPKAADIDELVLSAQAAGQHVDVDGGWGTVPSAQGYVLYRAVQEGLTNARRHAPRSLVTLARTRACSTVGFTMTNLSRGTGPAEPGRGIIGMRERVESLGGTMTAEFGEDRFHLMVTLPVDVTAHGRAEVSV
ncbi:sensor histidine kinase [Sanguibacter antarcticus]|uniref:histidine kinase n=1 Tax=Sanguibacter antarcticus TaxID=372484 RepID=A0A2A9E8H4_9MICO|nr:histidine kinase [Sanguibacter antarcticus]PFG34861.1 signal transduction histidine kinase [Sanguibacter antarcticus]